ncbi:hypothetical protein [Blastomonas sp.]|uniref:hypothetical protein n=1 Tax=Blastomonas sp. TaxID=1909299 RepID=UPI00262D90FF|nr:hypothetical protein [Blastomonas sp.]MDM7957138.1 hypothetical protein [Blastomonas sp.]
MSRQLLFSAMLSIVMMATFALGSQAYAGKGVQDFAECQSKVLNGENGVPARLVLAAL